MKSEQPQGHIQLQNEAGANENSAISRKYRPGYESELFPPLPVMVCCGGFRQPRTLKVNLCFGEKYYKLVERLGKHWEIFALLYTRRIQYSLHQ